MVWLLSLVLLQQKAANVDKINATPPEPDVRTVVLDALF